MVKGVNQDSIRAARFRGLAISILIIGFGVLLGILLEKEATYETRDRVNLLKKEAQTITSLLKNPAIRYIKSGGKDTMFEEMAATLDSSSLGVFDVHLLDRQGHQIFSTKKEPGATPRNIKKKYSFNFKMILKKLKGDQLSIQVKTPLYSDNTLIGFMDIDYPEDLSLSSFFKSKKEARRETVLSIVAVTIAILIILYILLIRHDRYTALTITKEIERKNMALSEEVKRNERLAVVGRMTASIAHDIRSPITSIKTFAQLLEGEYKDPEFRKNFIETITSQCDRIDRFINNMLDYSRPLSLHKDIWDISNIIEDAVTVVAGPENNHKIVTKDLPEGLMVSCDRDHMLTVIENILLNAIQASGKDSEIRLKASASDNSFYVEVTDNGPGIPESIREHIFDPFFTTRRDGTGLGLAICEKIVHAHGGEIKVESKDGIGTTVRVTIPLRSAPNETTTDSG